MTRRPPSRQRRVPYWLSYLITTLSLGGMSTAFVLVVLPKRFVLQAGLVESGVTFPTEAPPFRPPMRGQVVQPGLTLPPPLGPAEAFWNEALPFLENGDYNRAIPLFSHYLADHPEDTSIWREYAVTLLRNGSTEEAEKAYLELVNRTGDRAAKLELARLLRDREEYDRSIAIYRELIEEFPEDLTLRHELAKVLTWTQRYDEAIREYEQLLRLAPGAPRYQLELANVLYWTGDLEGALQLLREFPPGLPESESVASLRDLLEQLVAVPPAALSSVLDSARIALDMRDLAAAKALYERALAEKPNDPARWLEWINFLQFHVQDLAAAREALMHLASLRPLTDDERFRLAQLEAWTGGEDAAIGRLLALLEDDPRRIDAWRLLGDLYRWSGRPHRAAKAYAEALAVDDTDRAAADGLLSVRREVVRGRARRERPGVGPEVVYFGDSDQFRRLELAVRSAFQWFNTGLVVRAGHRRVEGFALSGTTGDDSGPFFETELVRWWGLGSVRTSVLAGVEELDAFGAEPTLAAQVEVPDLGGTSFTARYAHGPAYRQANTFESVLGSVRSDFVDFYAQRSLGERWSIAGSGGVAALDQTGPNNWRVSGTVSAQRAVTSVFNTGLTTTYLSYTGAAPVVEARRLYWDPRAFWLTGLVLELRSLNDPQWTWYARAEPGVALVRERNVPGSDFIPQLSTEAGVTYSTDRLLFGTEVAYARGREGEYNSFGLSFWFAIRP